MFDHAPNTTLLMGALMSGGDVMKLARQLSGIDERLEMIQKKYGELVVGDVLHVMGEDRTITAFEEHPGLERDGKHYTARVAMSGDWGITCFDDDCVRLTSSGTWITSHAWFDYEQRKKGSR